MPLFAYRIGGSSSVTPPVGYLPFREFFRVESSANESPFPPSKWDQLWPDALTMFLASGLLPSSTGFYNPACISMPGDLNYTHQRTGKVIMMLGGNLAPGGPPYNQYLWIASEIELPWLGPPIDQRP